MLIQILLISNFVDVTPYFSVFGMEYWLSGKLFDLLTNLTNLNLFGKLLDLFNLNLTKINPNNLNLVGKTILRYYGVISKKWQKYIPKTRII